MFTGDKFFANAVHSVIYLSFILNVITPYCPEFLDYSVLWVNLALGNPDALLNRVITSSRSTSLHMISLQPGIKMSFGWVLRFKNHQYVGNVCMWSCSQRMVVYRCRDKKGRILTQLLGWQLSVYQRHFVNHVLMIADSKVCVSDTDLSKELICVLIAAVIIIIIHFTYLTMLKYSIHVASHFTMPVRVQLRFIWRSHWGPSTTAQSR